MRNRIKCECAGLCIEKIFEKNDCFDGIMIKITKVESLCVTNLTSKYLSETFAERRLVRSLKVFKCFTDKRDATCVGIRITDYRLSSSQARRRSEENLAKRCACETTSFSLNT